MRLITHILFSIFILLLTARFTHLVYLIQIVILSFVNIVIDSAGHSAFRGPNRTPLTHSPLSATIVGGVYGLASYFILPIFGIVTPIIFMVGGGIVVAWSHLFLDSMTYNGIYVFKKRLALAHFKNGLIDIPFVLISLIVIIYLLGFFPVAI